MKETRGGARTGTGPKLAAQRAAEAALVDVVALSLMQTERIRLAFAMPGHDPSAAELRAAVRDRLDALLPPA